MYSRKLLSVKGFTFLELLTVLAITGILIAIANFNLLALEDPASNGASELMGVLKKARAKALSSSTAYTISPVSTDEVMATVGVSCSSITQTEDTSFRFELPSRAHLSDTTWVICYDPRGLANTSADIQISDNLITRTVQVVLGGAVRVL